MPQDSNDNKTAGFAISFIHEGCPEAAAKPSNISLIRSHAAVANHKRTREKRRENIQIRQYRPSVRATSVTQTDGNEGDGCGNLVQKAQADSKRQQHFATAASDQRQDTSDEAQYLIHVLQHLADLQARPQTYRSDPFQIYAWDPSQTERFLLNHCKLTRFLPLTSEATNIQPRRDFRSCQRLYRLRPWHHPAAVHPNPAVLLDPMVPRMRPAHGLHTHDSLSELVCTATRRRNL